MVLFAALREINKGHLSQLKEGDESGEKTQSFQEKNDPDYVPGAEPSTEDLELAEEDVEPEA